MIHFLLHFDTVVANIFQIYGEVSYSLIFLIVFMETGLIVTPFLPGDSLLFALGSLAARDVLYFHYIYFLVLSAAVLGDNVNYMVGRLVGKTILKHEWRLINKKHIARTNKLYKKHGGKAVFLARFIPVIRTFTPFIAGIGSMSYMRFVVFSVTGAIAWTSIFIFGGYYFGNIEVIRDNFILAMVAIVAISLLPVVLEHIKNRKALR